MAGAQLFLCFLIFMLILTSSKSALMVTLPVYNQTRTTSHAMIKSSLPGLREFTACFWFNGEPDSDDNRYEDWLLSFALPGNDNAMVIGFRASMQLTLLRGSTVIPLTTSTDDMTSWDSKHRHCFVWRDGQSFKWYLDVNNQGVLELFKSVAIPLSGSLASGATLALLHEQDAVGGGFNADQAMVGGLANFNLWDYAMTDSEIARLPCIPVGNVVNPSNIQYVGVPTFSTDTYPCKKLRPSPTINHSATTQNGVFCKLMGCQLNNHGLSTVPSPTAGKCVLTCLMNSLCVSANYRISTGECQHNYLRDVDTHPGDFVRNLGNDYIHLTSRPC